MTVGQIFTKAATEEPQVAAKCTYNWINSLHKYAMVIVHVRLRKIRFETLPCLFQTLYHVSCHDVYV